MTSLKPSAVYDDISIISVATGVSKMSTTSSAGSLLDVPITTTNTLDEVSPEVAEDICITLELDFTDQKDQIISDVLTKGRRILEQYQGELTPEVYSREINPETINVGTIEETHLLKVIKTHVYQRWAKACEKQPKIWEFILKIKEDNSEHFEIVIRRAAEYGTEYTKSSSILSIVLQLLFTGLDDECLLNEPKVFPDLWNSVTNEGLGSCNRFNRYITEDDLKEQIDDPTSILFLTLKIYYEEKVPELLKQHKIPDTKNTLHNLAAESVTRHGWISGIEAIKGRIPPNKYEPLIKRVREMMISNSATLEEPAPSSTTPSFNIQTDQDTSDVIKSQILSTVAKSSDDIHKQNGATESQSPPLALPPHLPTAHKSSQETTGIVCSPVVQNSDDANVIQKCILTERLTLEDLIEAGELKYDGKTFKEIAQDLVDQSFNNSDDHSGAANFPNFVRSCLTPIMFLMKRQQNLDDFMNTLTFVYEKTKRERTLQSSSSDKTVPLSLRVFQHILLSSSDIFLRRIIMSLISKRNPVPFVEPNIEDWNGPVKYEIIPSVIHVWNMQLPTLLSFPIGLCRGKSSLINSLFQSTFERHTDSIYFDYAIDIDFGYSFIPERSFNVADCHGQLPTSLLKQIRRLFDGFIIHLDQEYLEKSPETVTEFLQLLPADKFRIILVRDITSTFNKQRCLESIQTLTGQAAPQLIPLMNMSDTNNSQTIYSLQDLREQLLKKIKENIQSNIDKDDLYVDIHNLLKRDYANYLKDTAAIMKPLKKCLLENKSEVNDRSFPLYLKFTLLCKLRQELKKIDFYGSHSERSFELTTKIFDLESELEANGKKDEKCGDVFKFFIDLLKGNNMLMTLNLLSDELKKELFSQGADKLAGQLTVANSFLSLEVLWRNCIVCYDHTSATTQKLVTDSYSQFVLNGFPFEIIDGDNFHCQHKFLNEIIRNFTKDRILVISVIGPQNSGKSTLLNYMFGTLFDVRDGRCTRGIYGSLVKANIPKIDYILLIDTEGLLSVEKADKEYDRRLVLFCLGISHLVLVNMVSDVNETMKDMLILCADSLKQLKVTTIPQPAIHFILNQKADLNIKNHTEAINKIIADLKEKDLGEIINISADTFHTLPSAFKKERTLNDTTGPCLVRTEPDFLEQTQKLVGRIVVSARACYDRTNDANFTLRQWLNTSKTIFETLQKYPDLTYFKDINERRQDDKLRTLVCEMITTTLSAKERRKLIDQHCEKGGKEIRCEFQAAFQIHQDAFNERLENYLKLENAAERIRDRSRQFLARQVTETRNAWCTSTIEANDRKRMEALVRDGAADLKDLIDDIIKKGKTMTKDNATYDFEEMWEKKLKSIKNSFNSDERMQQAINFIYSNYNIFEKKMLPTHDFILTFAPDVAKLIQSSSIENVPMTLEQDFIEHMNKQKEQALQVLPKKHSVLTRSAVTGFNHLNKQVLMDFMFGSEMTSVDANSTGFMDLTEHKSIDQKGGPNLVVRGLNWLRGNDSSKKKDKKCSTSSSNTSAASLRPLPNSMKFEVQDRILKEMKSPCEPSNILFIRKIFADVMKKVLEVVSDNGSLIDRNNEKGKFTNNRRPIEIDLIQKIVGLINNEFNEINRELVDLDLSLSSVVMERIHLLVVIYLTILYFNEQHQHFQEQLETLNNQRQSLLQYFISLIVPDASLDNEGGKELTNQVHNTLQTLVSTKAQTIIENIQQSQQQLSRKELQRLCDGSLRTASITWLENYIKKPTEIIVEEFHRLWETLKNEIEAKIAGEKNQLKNDLAGFLYHIKAMQNALSGQGPAATFVNELFTNPTGSNAEQNLANKGQCMVLILFAYFKDEKIDKDTTFTVFDHTYRVTSKAVDYFQKLSKPGEGITSLFSSMTKSYRPSNTTSAAAALSTNTTSVIAPTSGATVASFRLSSIKNFADFLQSIVNNADRVMEHYEKDISTSFSFYDKDKMYMRLLDKAKGCSIKCPCCERTCDADHTSVRSQPGDEDNKHSCSTGHQLRAFAKIKFEVTNEASLYQCHEVENESFITINGVKKKWSEMKKDYLEWDFDASLSVSSDEAASFKSKFLHVWGKIGEEFCNTHNMKFVTCNTAPLLAEAFHYILLLDSSASMGGDRWENLITATNVLIQARIHDGAHDRITIITFDDSAKYFSVNEKLKDVNVQAIPYSNGGTCFGPAFQLVIDVIEKQTSAAWPNLKSIVVFMSDGEAEYPEIQLAKLEPFIDQQIREFWTVALGDMQMPLLERINSKMRGTFKQIKDPKDLIVVFGEIIDG